MVYTKIITKYTLCQKYIFILNKGASIGIIGGVIVFCLLLVICIYICKRKPRQVVGQRRTQIDNSERIDLENRISTHQQTHYYTSDQVSLENGKHKYSDPPPAYIPPNENDLTRTNTKY